MSLTPITVTKQHFANTTFGKVDKDTFLGVCAKASVKSDIAKNYYSGRKQSRMFLM